MLDCYFKYPGVLKRLRNGALGEEMDRIAGVVQNLPFLGYTGERKPPAFEVGFRLRRWPGQEAVSLPRSSAFWLQRSKAQQRQPMRVALAGHQLPRAFAGALGNPAAHEAVMVQVELQ